MDDVPRLEEEKTSQDKTKNENKEENTGKEIGKLCSAEFEFKTEVLEGIDANIFVVKKRESDITYVESTVKIESKIQPDDSVEDAANEKEAIQSTNLSTHATRVLEGVLKLFHAEVAREVKASLNLFYPEAKEFVRDPRIRSREQYKQVARQLSHHFREKIKESHRMLHGGLQGVRMTKEHQIFIRKKVKNFVTHS